MREMWQNVQMMFSAVVKTSEKTSACGFPGETPPEVQQFHNYQQETGIFDEFL